MIRKNKNSIFESILDVDSGSRMSEARNLSIGDVQYKAVSEDTKLNDAFEEKLSHAIDEVIQTSTADGATEALTNFKKAYDALPDKLTIGDLANVITMFDDAIDQIPDVDWKSELKKSLSDFINICKSLASGARHDVDSSYYDAHYAKHPHLTKWTHGSKENYMDMRSSTVPSNQKLVQKYTERTMKKSAHINEGYNDLGSIIDNTDLKLVLGEISQLQRDVQNNTYNYTAEELGEYCEELGERLTSIGEEFFK